MNQPSYGAEHVGVLQSMDGLAKQMEQMAMAAGDLVCGDGRDDKVG